MKNSKQVITDLAEALRTVKIGMVFFRQPTNQAAIVMEGFAFKSKLEVAPEPYNSFLLARAFPAGNAAINKPVPPELFRQLNQKNLIYYDWEITGPRMKQLNRFWQAYHLIHFRPTLSDSPSVEWVRAASEKLGNAVTQGILENRRQIKIVRQSPLGFNSMELLSLAHLLDDSDVVHPRVGQTQPTSAPPSAPQ